MFTVLLTNFKNLISQNTERFCQRKWRGSLTTAGADSKETILDQRDLLTSGDVAYLNNSKVHKGLEMTKVKVWKSG